MFATRNLLQALEFDNSELLTFGYLRWFNERRLCECFLFPFTSTFCQTIKGDEEDAFECLEKLQEMIPSLPRENRRLLHYLCRFLNRIAANEPINKMSCQGLGILFGPCVFRFDVRSQVGHFLL